MLILRSLFIAAMSRHYHVDVVTLGKFLEPVFQHYCRCRDIKKEFSYFRNFFTCLFHFISTNSVHACEYKSINIEESQFKHKQ